MLNLVKVLYAGKIEEYISDLDLNNINYTVHMITVLS